MKHTIVAMVEEANTSKNDTLKSAAQILHQYVFGNSKFSPPTNLYKPDNGKDGGKNAEMDKREQDFRQKQFTTAHSALNTKVSNVIKNTIAQHIDPRGSMTEYVKGHAVNEAVSQLNRLISNDARFRALLDKMWEKAFQSDFDEESTNRIRRAITSKAKTLLPSVIKRARNDALRGIGKRVREEEDTPSKRGPIPAGRPQSQSSGKIKKAGDIPKGMTTLEFLNSD
jgi:hypothetical protein